MTVRYAAVVLSVALLAARPLPGQWAPPRCELKPGHFLVNSAVLYLKNAAETKYADQRERSLRDADRVLHDALLDKGQDDNPAAWYYLGRYFGVVGDLAGADSAYRKAEQLAPQCAEDIAVWRRQIWTPVFNQGVKAYQAGATDSAIHYFRNAAVIYPEPNGLSAIATLFANAGELDSAASYYAAAARTAAGSDSQQVRQRREAMFNRGAVYNQAQRWSESEAAFKEFLAEYPDDVQALAGLATAYAQTGRQDSALATYQRLLDHAEQAEPRHIFAAGVAMFNAAPTEPDSGALVDQCRDARQPTRAQMRQVVAACRTAVGDSMTAYRADARKYYAGAAGAFEVGLKRGGNDRDGLFNLANAYYRLADSARMAGVTRRLYRADPMNRNVLRLHAAALQLQGQTDSTLSYLQLMDSALSAEVTVTSFELAPDGATWRALVTSLRDAPQPGFNLIVEFLNAHDEVVASDTVAVPALEPGATHEVLASGAGEGIAVWRYRRE